MSYSAYTEALQGKRAEAILKQQAFLTERADQAGDLSAEEREQADRMDAEIVRYTEEVEKQALREDMAAKADQFRVVAAPVIEAARIQRKDPTDREMLMALLRGERGAFESRVTDPDALRAMQSLGGSAIETSFADVFVTYERAAVPMLDVGNVINSGDGAPLVFPRLTADPSLAGTVTAEAGGITIADPTISSVTLGAFKYAGITTWSQELQQDNVIGIEQIVAKSLARQIAISGIGAALTTGGGTTAPWGIVTRAGNGGTALGTAQGQASDTFFSAYDLIDLYYSLAEPYRQVGTYLVSPTAAKKMRKFRDSTGAPLYEPSFVPGTPDAFNGRPVRENPAMAAVASATKSVVFGDMSTFFIRRVNPIRIERSTEYRFVNDEIAIKVVERVDSDLVDTAAVNYLVSANT